MVTLTVKSDDASSFEHRMTCHIDTGSDVGIVFQTNRKAVEYGLALNDRSAIVEDPEAQLELADGSIVEYIVDFLLITHWIDGKQRWVKVFIPPYDPRRESYQRADALLGIELLKSAAFRLNHSQHLVELTTPD